MSRDIASVDRRTLLKAAGAAGIIGLAGCVGEEPENGEGGNGGNGEGGEESMGEGDEPEEGGERITWHAGGTDGTYYPLSGEIKNVVDDNTPHVLQVQSTGASVENVGSLNEGTADFALIQNDIAYFAVNGTGIDEFEGNPVESLRGVATLYPETIHILVNPDANVESLEDLEGATVNTGDLGSGTQVNALQILETAGLTTDDFSEQNAGFGTASDQIRDGDVDAAFVVGGWPVGAVEDLATTTEVEILNLDQGTRDALLEDAEWFAEDTIPGGTYDGIDEDVETVSVQAMIATREDLDEGVVEDVTTAIFDNEGDIETKGEFIDAETAQDAMSIDLHPGAEAYFG